MNEWRRHPFKLSVKLKLAASELIYMAPTFVIKTTVIISKIAKDIETKEGEYNNPAKIPPQLVIESSRLVTYNNANMLRIRPITDKAKIAARLPFW